MDDSNSGRGGRNGGGRWRGIGDSIGGRRRKWVFHDENGGVESTVTIEKLSDELDRGDEMAHSRRRDKNQLRRLHVSDRRWKWKRECLAFLRRRSCFSEINGTIKILN